MKNYLLVLFLFFYVGTSVTLKGRVSFPPGLPQTKLKYTLDDVQLSLTSTHSQISLLTYSHLDSSFFFRNIPSSDNSYLLEAYHPFYFFPIYNLTISNSVITFSPIEPSSSIDFASPSNTFYITSAEHREINVVAKGQYDYFQKRQQMNILGMLMNPMVLMMVVSMGLMFLMPKMMEGIDPEEMKKMQLEQSKQQKDASKMMRGILGNKNDSDSDSD